MTVRTGRRAFLQAGGLALSSLAIAGGAEPPPVTEPRATSGDAIEPNWSQRLTLTVGPHDADLMGTTDRALQAAIDYVARLGGGTVHILPGTYTLRNALYLAGGVRLLGAGPETRLVKAASVSSPLAVDSDWYDQEITLAQPAGFQVGDGICLRTKNADHGGTDVVKRTLVARDGSRFKLDKALRQNFWLLGETTVATLFPILSGEEIADVALENLTLDGNRAENLNLDGNYAGCIFLQDCNRFVIRGVDAGNYNGDGISWQICHDVRVEDCTSHDHAGLGLHPGSGSQRPIMRNNRLERNDIGLFFCWGVKYGLAEGNVLRENRVGVSLGHRDTDNLVVDNQIVGSRETGVLFRPERGKDFAPHRNRLERNRIVDSGQDEGIAVDVQGETEACKIIDNHIEETRAPLKRIGIRLGRETRAIEVRDNQIAGVAHQVTDLREAP